MARIFSNTEEAKQVFKTGVVFVSTQLRNPVRYPTIAVGDQIFADLANVPESYRELVRACLMGQIESVLKQAIKAGQDFVSDDLLMLESLIAEASANGSGKLTKEQFMEQFLTSTLGQKVITMRKTNPSMAKKMEDTIATCHSVRAAATLNETATAQILTILAKPEYAVDGDAQWYLQALASIEGAQAKRAGISLDSAF